ncbi:hypothetical protein, partial [Acinetobacter soli]
MLTAFIEIIISFFIANFEAKNHPYLISFIKGIIAGLVAFLLIATKIYFNLGYLDFDNIQFGIFICLSIGFILSLILM